MKIATLKLTRDTWTDDYRCNSNLFACGKKFRGFFPHITPKRKQLTMTVYSHAVKGSKLFHISQKICKSNEGGTWIEYQIQEAEDDGIYSTLEYAVKDILCKFRPKTVSSGKAKMPIWVIVK